MLGLRWEMVGCQLSMRGRKRRGRRGGVGTRIGLEGERLCVYVKLACIAMVLDVSDPFWGTVSNTR